MPFIIFGSTTNKDFAVAYVLAVNVIPVATPQRSLVDIDTTFPAPECRYVVSYVVICQ